jgi:NAD(P)-dependent dehydrogenase (short-subunit alcohol dehydrogenase family)
MIAAACLLPVWLTKKYGTTSRPRRHHRQSAACNSFALQTDVLINKAGRVDVIVNNAGIAQAPTPLIDMGLADFGRIFDVNIYGMLNGIQVFGKIFQTQGTPGGIYHLGSKNWPKKTICKKHNFR